jgi:hypothetical protein
MKPSTLISLVFVSLALLPAVAQSAPPGTEPLAVTGQIVLAGQPAQFRVWHLPVSSFPQLPEAVQAQLLHRGCQIPQTFQAHGPENVIHASFERPGSSDWAVLCAAQGTVSLLVFFASNPTQSFVLAAAPETERLQVHDASGVLGFNWGIDPAPPARVHEAQAGLPHRPPPPDHDALADSFIDRKTIYHFYAKSAWIVLDMPD